VRRPWLHQPWCGRQGAPHAACLLTLDRIELSPSGLWLIVQLHQARDVPALLTLTTERAGRQQIIPVDIRHAPRLARAVDKAVRLVFDDPFARE
jgi:hypothetical protein